MKSTIVVCSSTSKDTYSETIFCCFSKSLKPPSESSMSVSAFSGSNEIYIAASLTPALV